MDEQSNPLNDNNSQRLSGWSMLAFVVTAPLIGLLVFWLLPARSNLWVLSAFFGTCLLALVISVLPLGRNAPAALGLRAVGWRPVVFAVLGTALSMLQLLVYSVLARQGQKSVYLVWAALVMLVGIGYTADSLSGLLAVVLTVDTTLFALLFVISLVRSREPDVVQ